MCLFIAYDLRTRMAEPLNLYRQNLVVFLWNLQKLTLCLRHGHILLHHLKHINWRSLSVLFDHFCRISWQLIITVFFATATLFSFANMDCSGNFLLFFLNVTKNNNFASHGKEYSASTLSVSVAFKIMRTVYCDRFNIQ